MVGYSSIGRALCSGGRDGLSSGEARGAKGREGPGTGSSRGATSKECRNDPLLSSCAASCRSCRVAYRARSPRRDRPRFGWMSCPKSGSDSRASPFRPFLRFGDRPCHLGPSSKVGTASPRWISNSPLRLGLSNHGCRSSSRLGGSGRGRRGGSVGGGRRIPAMSDARTSWSVISAVSRTLVGGYLGGCAFSSRPRPSRPSRARVSLGGLPRQSWSPRGRGTAARRARWPMGSGRTRRARAGAGGGGARGAPCAACALRRCS